MSVVMRRACRPGLVGVSVFAITAGLMTGLAGTATAAPAVFTATGPMADARLGATATLLTNGKVLVTGGYNGSSNLASTSIYDPATGTFTTGPAMNSASNGGIAAPLNNGTVLLAGGWNGTTAVATPQRYNPDTNSYLTTAGNMAKAVVQPGAVVLNDGKVLVTGGAEGVNAQKYSQLYNPASGVGGAFVATPEMAVARIEMGIVRLANGDVLVAGGRDFGGTATATAETYSPTGNNYTNTSPMTTARYGATATLLSNGKVLIAGGRGSIFHNGTELYDPNSRSFSAGPPMSSARAFATATKLADGKVLIAGGTDQSTYLSSTEIYDPQTNTFSAGPAMTAARSGANAVALNNGKVLIAGGITTGSAYLSSAELFSPATVDPDPVVTVAQHPVNCSALPKKLKRKGDTVILKKHCVTNAGVRVGTTAKKVGKAKKPFKLIRKSNGKVIIRTRGLHNIRIKVIRKASATTGFHAYEHSKTYRIK